MTIKNINNFLKLEYVRTEKGPETRHAEEGLAKQICNILLYHTHSNSKIV